MVQQDAGWSGQGAWKCCSQQERGAGGDCAAHRRRDRPATRPVHTSTRSSGAQAHPTHFHREHDTASQDVPSKHLLSERGGRTGRAVCLSPVDKKPQTQLKMKNPKSPCAGPSVTHRHNSHLSLDETVRQTPREHQSVDNYLLSIRYRNTCGLATYCVVSFRPPSVGSGSYSWELCSWERCGRILFDDHNHHSVILSCRKFWIEFYCAHIHCLESFHLN